MKERTWGRTRSLLERLQGTATGQVLQDAEEMLREGGLTDEERRVVVQALLAHVDVPELRDLSLLALDKSRTWWEDIESDVFRGNDAYVRILNQWAAISRGTFRPERIAEQWHSDQGPVDVSFAVAGRDITWSTDVVEWIDDRLLDTINTLIVPTGVQFQQFFTGDQSTFVVALTRKEREAIARERPWNLDLSLDRY